MTTQGMKKTAFLDTNALIRLFGFWEACEEKRQGFHGFCNGLERSAL